MVQQFDSAFETSSLLVNATIFLSFELDLEFGV